MKYISPELIEQVPLEQSFVKTKQEEIKPFSELSKKEQEELKENLQVQKQQVQKQEAPSSCIIATQQDIIEYQKKVDPQPWDVKSQYENDTTITVNYYNNSKSTIFKGKGIRCHTDSEGNQTILQY